MSAWALPPSAVAADVPALLPQLDGVDAIDAAALTRFDSATVALLLEAKRRAAARGAKLSIANLPPRLADLARLYGVADLLGV